jgi:hypothetical protein
MRLWAAGIDRRRASGPTTDGNEEDNLSREALIMQRLCATRLRTRSLIRAELESYGFVVNRPGDTPTGTVDVLAR